MRTFDRLIKKHIVALSIFSAASVICAPTVASAQQAVHFMMDFLPSGEYAAYYSGWTKGFWKEEGIDITISRGYGSSDTVSKIANGAADFGVGDIGAVLTARSRAGAPVKAISALYTYSPHSFFVLESSGIDTLNDLEGKRLGITPGNSHRIYFPEVAQRIGFPEDSVTWVNVDATAMGTLLIQKQIDAAPLYSMHYYYNNKAAQSAGESIKVLPYVETGFKIYSNAVFASDSTIANRREVVEAFLRGLQKSLNWAKDNQEEACKLHIEHVPGLPLDDCMGSLSVMLEHVFNEDSERDGLGRFNPDQLAFTYETVAKAQDLDPAWDPQQALDTGMLPPR